MSPAVELSRIFCISALSQNQHSQLIPRVPCTIIYMQHKAMLVALVATAMAVGSAQAFSGDSTSFMPSSNSITLN